VTQQNIKTKCSQKIEKTNITKPFGLRIQPTAQTEFLCCLFISCKILQQLSSLRHNAAGNVTVVNKLLTVLFSLNYGNKSDVGFLN
jgi:hypothetical protein